MKSLEITRDFPKFNPSPFSQVVEKIVHHRYAVPVTELVEVPVPYEEVVVRTVCGHTFGLFFDALTKFFNYFL